MEYNIVWVRGHVEVYGFASPPTTSGKRGRNWPFRPEPSAAARCNITQTYRLRKEKGLFRQFFFPVRRQTIFFYIFFRKTLDFSKIYDMM